MVRNVNFSLSDQILMFVAFKALAALIDRWDAQQGRHVELRSVLVPAANRLFSILYRQRQDSE